ncbi:polyphosphate polymerase domain-containing protein [Aeromicrobium sp.]|uniref:polyphosphate polymerase domain-containing protein n=1 Tax=Aeromicrobium sp. TaxID=1871063 RepID=UPI0019BA887B|nr:polyphosphate polymerase domain-containing protein [Aeromicrobium sp.]MBC7631699.1 polyphosphate polymerase domain-containing protein [Aeromicrobium sp.]
MTAETVAPVTEQTTLSSALAAFRTLTLAETVERADLRTRVDRKYLVPVTTVDGILGELRATHQVLEVNGRLATTYRTTYFDTADFASCRTHIQGRRRRWKVRSRLYSEDQFCRVEVKTKDGRGFTVKAAKPTEPERYGTLTGHDEAFVADVLNDEQPDLDIAALVATSEITYVRAALVDVAAGTRLTIDTDLRCTLGGRRAWLDDDVAVVETKGGPTPSAVDRLLIRHGARERSFSKYVATASLLHPTIPDNDVRALRGTHLHTDALLHSR